MTFYEAALRVLESEARPLHVQEITQKSVQQNLLSHVGKTPEQTMLFNEPEVLAAIHNALIGLWRRAGWTNMADAVRATAASVTTALTFIGAHRL